MSKFYNEKSELEWIVNVLSGDYEPEVEEDCNESEESDQMFQVPALVKHLKQTESRRSVVKGDEKAD